MQELAQLSVDKFVRRLGRKALRAYNAHSPLPRGKVRAVRMFNPYFSRLEPMELTVVHNSITMDLDLREFVQQFIYYNLWEPDVRNTLLSVLRPGMTFLDIGANVGYYTLLAAYAVGSTGTVHAFEANPQVFETLRGNVQRNGFKRTSLNNVALTNVIGQVTFCIDELNPGSSSLSGKGFVKAAQISVPGITLDSYTQSKHLNRVDVIKIDVEGAEILVFSGAKNTLMRFRPDIVGEFSKQMMTRESGGEREIVDLLTSLQYRAFLLARGKLTPLPIDRIYETGTFAPELYLTTRAHI
jgi:FkbM family methyltransferase